jgi:hypothetical protein
VRDGQERVFVSMVRESSSNHTLLCDMFRKHIIQFAHLFRLISYIKLSSHASKGVSPYFTHGVP